MKFLIFPQHSATNGDTLFAMTKVVQAFRPKVSNEGQDDRLNGGEVRDGTQAAVMSHQPLAPIYGDQGNGGQGQQDGNQNLVDQLANANTGVLKSWAKNATRNEQQQFWPSDSPLHLIGDSARAVTYSRNSKIENNRSNWVAGPFNPNAKFSPLAGAPIVFDTGDNPFNPATQHDTQATTIPQEDWKQMQGGMDNARVNRGPSTWAMRHSRIRV